MKTFASPLPACLAPLTLPLSAIYTAATAARNFAYDRFPSLSRPLPHPTISIGGIRAGGVGKTPVAQLIGRHILDNHPNHGIAFLSRGYGRISKHPVIVRPREKNIKWEDTGDEPCMIHSNIPESWLGIGADRAALAQRLSPHLPPKSVFILDDGFQRRQTRRDLDIVCVSESALADRMLPLGYLREPVSSLARAGVILIIGTEERLDELMRVKQMVEDMSVSICAILLQYPHSWVNGATGEARPVGDPPLKNPVAVSGIARPERFTAMLRSLSVDPFSVRSFGDHHKFKNDVFLSDHDIYSKGAVTTEKDFVRLRSKKFASACELWYLKIGLRFSDSGSEARVKLKINDVFS